MPHKFQVAQKVRLKASGFSNGQPSPDGVYDVTRLMPADRASEYSYRLKSAAGERVARESEIESIEVASIEVATAEAVAD